MPRGARRVRRVLWEKRVEKEKQEAEAQREKEREREQEELVARLVAEGREAEIPAMLRKIKKKKKRKKTPKVVKVLRKVRVMLSTCVPHASMSCRLPALARADTHSCDRSYRPEKPWRRTLWTGPTRTPTMTTCASRGRA